MGDILAKTPLCRALAASQMILAMFTAVALGAIIALLSRVAHSQEQQDPKQDAST